MHECESVMQSCLSLKVLPPDQGLELLLPEIEEMVRKGILNLWKEDNRGPTELTEGRGSILCTPSSVLSIFFKCVGKEPSLITLGPPTSAFNQQLAF